MEKIISQAEQRVFQGVMVAATTDPHNCSNCRIWVAIITGTIAYSKQTLASERDKRTGYLRGGGILNSDGQTVITNCGDGHKVVSVRRRGPTIIIVAPGDDRAVLLF